MSKYQPKTIEEKWQKAWEENEINRALDTKSSKAKKYILDMFPYPSGDGLHVGHFKVYTASDAISRYYRLKGYNVLHPMGWDAFGLPAENYAIKTGIHPKLTTAQNISNIKKQMQMTGLSYDWSREINTTDPEYYKWTQWIFLKLFEAGLAYEAEAPINWCPSCKTGLANEEVAEGKCDRCGTPVEMKNIRQWILRITEFAERLLSDLEGLDWPQSIMDMQINWIGKSQGLEIDFPVVIPSEVEGSLDLIVYTKFPETIFGVTYLVIAPEHSLVDKLTTKDNQESVQEYIKLSINKSELERTSLDKQKTGVFTGSYCINPVNGKKVPVWVADYVIGNYGTGAVMGVPGADERDFEFAKKFDLENIKSDIDAEARIKVIADLVAKGCASKKTNYHLRDWIFSRQRYWGEPIPLVHCDKCGIVGIPESELPLMLPEVEKYEPTGTGDSPLAAITDWVNTTCPKCIGKAKRETNTMPQWAGSCWYYLRFCDPNNISSLISKDIEKYWMNIDWYIGGAEHAVLHLLYARFWHKFLYDLGVVSTKEPFQKLSGVGLVLAEDGRKMSKSLGNVVRPDDIIRQYGADTLRVYECFMGPFENTIAWDPTSINGAYKFLCRVWEVIEKGNAPTPDLKIDSKLFKLSNKVSNDIERMKFNTAIAAMMEFINFVYHLPLTKEQKQSFLIILSPFAPHITEELFEKIGGKFSIHQQSWPRFQDSLIEDSEVIIAVQINGKLRDTIVLTNNDLTQSEIEQLAKQSDKTSKFLKGQNIKKVIYIKNKIINFVI